MPSFLDLGEATSIALAAMHKNSLLIIDESKGRKVTKEVEKQVSGSWGLLVKAKNKGHIETVKPIIEKIQ